MEMVWERLHNSFKTVGFDPKLIVIDYSSYFLIHELTHGDNVTTDVLARICFALDADVGDIMEIIPDDKGETTHGA